MFKKIIGAALIPYKRKVEVFKDTATDITRNRSKNTLINTTSDKLR